MSTSQNLAQDALISKFLTEKTSTFSSSEQQRKFSRSAALRAGSIPFYVLENVFGHKKSFDYETDDSVYQFILQTMGLRSIWKELLTTEQSVVFFQNAIRKTLHLIQEKHYTQLDAHTTSNCCHGISLFVTLSIHSLQKQNLNALDEAISNSFFSYHNHSFDINQIVQDLPDALLALVSSFVLCQAGALIKNKGRVTAPESLLSINPGASKKFCIKLIKKLQRAFSKAIAKNYLTLADFIPESHIILGTQTKLWAKYAQDKYIRSDKRGLHYASCLFSTQVTLAYLAYTHKKIAIVNDIITTKGEKADDKYIVLMQGNGSGFDIIDPQNYGLLAESESIFVIGGFTISDEHNLETFSKTMQPWLERITHLIVSADSFYPQFPKVGDDSLFDSSPIIPEEKELQTLICQAKQVKGVSKEDPSFFFQNHYYPASVREVLAQIKKEANLLPFSPDFTPHSLSR